MKTIQSPEDLVAWAGLNLVEDRNRAPETLSRRDVVLYRYLARRDGRRYGMPVVDAEGEVVAISWNHAFRRHLERIARLTEAVEAEVAPVRSYIANLLSGIAVQDARIEVATQALGDVKPPDLEARKPGESETSPEIIRDRRSRDHQEAVASLLGDLENARKSRDALAVTLADAELALVKRWELHTKNVASWWTYLGRLGEVIARGAARHHSNPTTASTLMRRVIAEAKPQLAPTHPWTPNHH